MKIRSLQLNKPPMSFDGHCGHSVRTPLERPLEQFEVKVSKITDKEKLFQHMTHNYDEYQKRIDNKSKKSEKIEESYNILNESVAASSHSVGKIKKTGNKNIKPTPIDTIQYRQAARILYDEIEKKETQPNFDKEILHCLKVNLIKITVMCKKLGARDSKNRTNVIMGKLENASSKDFWEVANALLEVPPVRELKNTVEEHMDEVVTLQMNTITDPDNYKGHTFAAKHKIKLSDFRASLHGNKFTPSVLKCYRKLKGHTKGHTGVSRNLIDSLPIGMFRMIVLTPILSAIEEGTYPKCWRTNRTTILPKKKGIRPLSISEVFSTILEKLIIGQINDYLENNELLHTTQNGFRAGLSTASSLATVINYIAEKRAQGNYVIVSALDAKNAFGSPPHKSLVKCLENVFTGKALKLLSESLGRNAVVASNGIFSSHRQLADLGVPQGSVISPSIFCLYASELRNALDPSDENTHCSIFADDCILLSCGKTLQDAIQKTEEIFDLVGEKMKSIGMVQVPEKTAVIITGKEGCHLKDNSNYPKSINCNGTEVKISSHFTYLGTELGEANHKLSYSFNTEKLITKMLQMTNRTRSLAGYIKDRDLQSVQRAISLGSYCHNSETTAKWPAKDHERAQNTHIRGLRSKYKPWFLRKYEDFDAASIERKIETLKNSGQPTLFEAKLSKFYGLLNKTIRLSKATSLLKEITRGIWIVNTKSERQIMPIFNLYHTDRELHKERYFKREFNLSTNIQTREFRAAHHFSNIIKILLARDIITLKIIQPKEISSEAARIMWPYTLMHDYNTLPSFIRGNVISRDQKKLITSYLKGNHKHLKQNLKCQDCITGKSNNLPYNVTNLKRNILDNECTTEIKIQAEKETGLMTEELTYTLITDTASTILSETNTGREIESMWETELDDSEMCPDDALQKLLAICTAFGAGIRIWDEIASAIKNNTSPHECISFGIIMVEKKEVELLNMYEMITWLNDPINSDKVTISDTRIIDTDNRAAAILDITDEYANDHRGFLPGIDELNNEAISSYAHKVFKRTTKMETDRALAEWCEGTNIAAIFAKIPKRDVNPNSWEVLLEGLKAKNMSLDNLQMKPLKYKLNTKSAKELGSQAEEKLAEIIKIKKQQAPIEKIENAMLYRQILNICDQVNGETYSFYALLEATGFKPNKDRDQERAMDYIRECSSRK
ncbi:unnamed protein product [Oikopleura dioica]|uniref:Reverse transcriptase domain-containing protein n=1 Tax=Oikopleura dioica TaxID=34765 RepID=E4YX78_OIKDI|nr:unnamed protein product [Oikopleura dioica]